MTDKNQVDEEVRITLEMLNPRERIQYSPGFQSRVMASIRELEQGRIQYRFNHPIRSFAAAVFAFLVVCINATSLIWVLNDTETSTYTNKSYLTAVVENYNRNNDSNYLVYLNNRMNQ